LGKEKDEYWNWKKKPWKTTSSPLVEEEQGCWISKTWGKGGGSVTLWQGNNISHQPSKQGKVVRKKMRRQAKGKN